MVKAVFDESGKDRPRNHFTIGIRDDVTHTSLDFDPAFSTEDPDTVRAVFYGLGSDGTVGANKNSIKIIGQETDLYAQGYFVYDSKKAGSVTISHLRFGPRPIRSTYLISRAGFVACHQFSFLDRIDVLREADEGATFLLNSPHGPDEVWGRLPRSVQETILRKKLRFFVINAFEVAPRKRHGRPHQYRHADLFLRIERRTAARAGDCVHQEGHRQDLRQARPICRGQKLRRRGRGPGASARGSRPRSRRRRRR